MSGGQTDLEWRKLELEERKVALAERQERHENHWVRQWAPILIPAILSLAGVLITTIISTHMTAIADYEQKQQAELANARAAAEMYFDKLADLRTKSTLTLAEQKRYVEELQIVTALTDNLAIQTLLQNEAASYIQATLSQGLQSGGQTVSPNQAAQGLPDLVSGSGAAGTYQAADFLAYPQAPQGNQNAARNLSDALGALGFNVQPAQYMADHKSPGGNEIRYYRADQKTFAEQTAQALAQRTGMKFSTKLLTIPGLPNGVIEFWVGTNMAGAKS